MAYRYSIEQLNHGHKIHDFMRWERLAFALSGLLLVSSCLLMSIKGFNWSLDFTGGSVIEISLENTTDVDQLREALKKFGFVSAQVQNFGSSHDILVRMSPNEGNTSQKLARKVVNIISQTSQQNAIIKRIEFVGPNVGSDLAQAGGIALLVALIAILIYIGFRFEWHLALSVVLALAHDVVITMGVLSLLHIEIDLTIIAALMSVIGYSLNDSIVVSDRIRENFRKIRRGAPYDIVNASITQTLNRTIITSATTLVVVLILFVFGGALLKGFSLTMLIGVSIGTISSIYVASALALKFGMKREHMLQQKVEKEGKGHSSMLP